jgi:hypothetical protein
LVGLGRIDEAESLARRARELLAEEDPKRAEAIAAWMHEAAATQE